MKVLEGRYVLCRLLLRGMANPHPSLPSLSIHFKTQGLEGCKFAREGVDQTRRRPLNLQAGLGFAPFATLICAKLRLRRLCLLLFKVGAHPTPAPLRVTIGVGAAISSVHSR